MFTRESVRFLLYHQNYTIKTTDDLQRALLACLEFDINQLKIKSNWKKDLDSVSTLCQIIFRLLNQNDATMRKNKYIV